MPNRRRISVPGKRGAAYDRPGPAILELERTLARLAPDCRTYDELAIRAWLDGARVPLLRVRRALHGVVSDLAASFEQLSNAHGDAIDAAEEVTNKMRPSAETRVRRNPYVRSLWRNAGGFAPLLAAITAVFQIGWGDDPAWDTPDDTNDPLTDIASTVVRTLGIEPLPAHLSPGIAELVQVRPDWFQKVGVLPVNGLPAKVHELNDGDLDVARALVCAVIEFPQVVLSEIKCITGVDDPRLGAVLQALSTNVVDWRSYAGLVVIVAIIHHRLRSDEVTRRLPGVAAELDAVVSTARRIIDGQAAA